LLQIFKNKIQDIVGQVRDKLNKDAKEYKLITAVLKDATNIKMQ